MGKQTAIKVISAWALYVFMHFTFKLFPSPFTAFLGRTEETIYTHMKMAFFSYLIINVIFYAAGRFRKQGQSVYAGMLANCIYPYLAFFIWMIVPALFGQIYVPAAEVIYSNLILALCLYMTVSMENNFSRLSWSNSGKAVIIFFFVTSCVLYTAMTLNKPAIELFEYHSHGSENTR